MVGRMFTEPSFSFSVCLTFSMIQCWGRAVLAKVSLFWSVSPSSPFAPHTHPGKDSSLTLVTNLVSLMRLCPWEADLCSAQGHLRNPVTFAKMKPEGVHRLKDHNITKPVFGGVLFCFSSLAKFALPFDCWGRCSIYVTKQCLLGGKR